MNMLDCIDDTLFQYLTCSKIDHDIDKEYCIGKTIEGNPSHTEIVVKKANGHWQDDQVGY